MITQRVHYLLTKRYTERQIAESSDDAILSVVVECLQHFDGDTTPDVVMSYLRGHGFAPDLTTRDMVLVYLRTLRARGHVSPLDPADPDHCRWRYTGKGSPRCE